MIRHIVMFEFLEEANGKSAMDNAGIAKEMLLGLKDKIDFIRKIEVGINTKEANDSNFTLSLTCDFNTIDDLNKYQVHPEHVKVAEFIGAVRKSRACVDYEI